MYHMEKRRNSRRNILSNIIWELPKLATDVKPLVQKVQNSKKDEYWQNKAKLYPGISYSDCWKPKTREDLERNQRKMLTIPYPEEQGLLLWLHCNSEAVWVRREEEIFEVMWKKNITFLEFYIHWNNPSKVKEL